MAAQNFSRKRPAPGAEPVGYSQQMPQSTSSYNTAMGPGLSNDEFLNWGSAPLQQQNTYQDNTVFNAGLSTYPQANLPLSNQVVRRPMTQVVTRQPVNVNSQWMADQNIAPPAPANGGWEDDLEDLEQKAQVAKRDAAAKRKQIPPFVLKLRSFVEDPKNIELIRWTDDGKSFVVLDEDEFAKKLIPELFKHNNYASFVRQLNMYGFHKKVGLSDNSMRASERKSKSPSEYSNPYFRRGYPDLMWLIQKPKNVTANAKGKGRIKSENDNIEDGEEIQEEIGNEPRVKPRPQLTLGDGSNVSAFNERLEEVQRSLQMIRRTQAHISQALETVTRNHEMLLGQAAAVQDQHNRHENSINAILTFLATIYQRSISGGANDAGQNMASLFGATLQPDSSKNGTVVDVGNYNFPGMEDLNNKPFKKPQLLLTDGQNRATTMSPGSASSPAMLNSRQSSHIPSVNSPQIEEVFENGAIESNSSAFQQNAGFNGNQRNQDIMSVIENTNARNPNQKTPAADFTNALKTLEYSQGKNPITNAERQNMIRMINSNANQSGDNALINNNPSSAQANFNRHLATTKADLDALAKMQAAQDESVEKLTNLLQPLSPSGSIPGINDGQQLPPPPMDIDDFLGENSYFPGFHSEGTNPLDFGTGNSANNGTFNWDEGADDDELFAGIGSDDHIDFLKNEYDDSNNFLNVGNQDGGGRVESVASSEVTTPKHSSVGVPEDEVQSGSNGRNKGRKLSTVEEESAKVKRRRKS